jgi:hypothetical protein
MSFQLFPCLSAPVLRGQSSEYGIYVLSQVNSLDSLQDPNRLLFDAESVCHATLIGDSDNTSLLNFHT